MKRLNNFKKEINKCSRCGLCHAVCPIYQLTKNDCTSPRGKLILYNELLKSGKKPSKTTKEYLKMCLDCGECTKYCPGKIDISKINAAYKKDYPSFNFKITQIPLLIRFLYNMLAERFNKNKNIQKNKKIVYQKTYLQEKIPAEIEKSNCTILKNCGASINFAINNPTLYKKLAIISAQKILEQNPDIIYTGNYLSKTQLQIGLKLIKTPKSIIYIK